MQDAKFVEKYWQQEKASEKKMSPASPQVLTELLGSGKGLPEFLNGRKLRDYQEDSFKWMVQHALTNSSCILGDEMGLGKTAQVCVHIYVSEGLAWPKNQPQKIRFVGSDTQMPRSSNSSSRVGGGCCQIDDR